MAEYISRDAAIEEIDKWLDTVGTVLVGKGLSYYGELIGCIEDTPVADVAPVVHGRCPICSGRKILTQDCDNGYSVEVDAEQGEMSIWQGDTCLTVISIDYCPNCGAKMDGGDSDAKSV